MDSAIQKPTYTPPDPTLQLLQTSGTFIQFIFVVLYIAGLWKVFEKAGIKGWKALIPIYNAYLTIKLIGRPGWWILLLFVPIVNLIMIVVVSLDLGKAFGKGTLFSFFLLAIFSFIGYPILGFGTAQFKGQQPQQPQNPSQPPTSQPAQPQQPPTVVDPTQQ